MTDSLRKLAEQRLTIDYEEDGRWRIAYHLERGAVISFNNRMCADQVKVQLRGILAEFASHLQPQAPERCKHGVWAADHCYQCEAEPQAPSERPDHYLTWLEDLIALLSKIRRNHHRPVYASLNNGEEVEFRFFVIPRAESAPKPEGK